MNCEINGNFLDKTRAKARERADSLYPNNSDLVYTDAELEDRWDTEIDIERNLLRVNVQNALGTFHIVVPFELDDEIKVLEHASRQVNKMKAALQSMK